MKRLFYIATFLCLYLLWGFSHEEILGEDNVLVVSEAVMKEKSTATDMQHRIEMISNDLKNSNCQVPRRNLQTTNGTHYSHVSYNLIRTMYEVRMKGVDQLQKVSEYTVYCQTSNFAALLCRMGYHVYALRKIRI